MDELAKRFADLAAQYGPSVAEAAKAAARTEAYSSLVLSLVLAVLATFFLVGGRYLWRRAEKANSFDKEFIYVPAVLGLIIGLGFGLGCLWTWIDPWTWAAINHPELWLAKKAFHI